MADFVDNPAASQSATRKQVPMGIAYLMITILLAAIVAFSGIGKIRHDQYSSSCPCVESLVHRPDKKVNGCKAGTAFCQKATKGFMCNTKINARKKSRLMRPPEIMMI
jgi:hypothetical protein